MLDLRCYLPTSLGTFPGSWSRGQDPLSTTSTVSFARSEEGNLQKRCCRKSYFSFPHQWQVGHSHWSPASTLWWHQLHLAGEGRQVHSKCCALCQLTPGTKRFTQWQQSLRSPQSLLQLLWWLFAPLQLDSGAQGQPANGNLNKKGEKEHCLKKTNVGI